MIRCRLFGNKTTGYHSNCMKCANELLRDYVRRNPHKAREWTARQVAKDPERYRALHRANWHKQKERARQKELQAKSAGDSI